jgi:hypothetical protein
MSKLPMTPLAIAGNVFERITSPAEVNDNDANAESARHDLLLQVAQTEPQLALAASDADRQTSRDDAERKANAGVRKFAIGAGSGVLAVSLAVGGALFVIHEGASTAKHIADDIKDGVLGLVNGAVKPSLDVQTQTALRKVELDDKQQFSYGIVESTTKLDNTISGCLGWCKTITGQHVNATSINRIDGVIDGTAISLTSGHTGDGKKVNEYYTVATIDPRTLTGEANNPTREELRSAEYPENTQLVTLGGKDGTLTEIASAVGGAIGVINENPDASLYEFAIGRNTHASLANCGEQLDETILPGLANVIHNKLAQSATLVGSIPAGNGGEKISTLLSAMAKNKVHFKFQYDESEDVTNSHKKPRTITVDPTSLHLYQGAEIKDIHTTVSAYAGAAKADFELTTAMKDKCQISPEAHKELEQINSGGQMNYVLDYQPVAVASTMTVKQGN